MKNLIFQGVRNPLLVIAILAITLVSTSCTKDSPGPAPTPPSGGGGGTTTATLTVSAAPTSPLWNASNTWTFTVASSNATSVTAVVNGVSQVVSGGQFTVNNLTENTEIAFSTNVGTAVISAAPVYRTINVVKPRLTILAKDIPEGWTNVFRRDSAYSGTTWGTPANGTFCAKWKFDVDNSCTLMNEASSCGGNNSPNTNVLNGPETTMTVGQRVFTIVSLTSTTLIVRDYGTTVCVERTFTPH